MRLPMQLHSGLLRGLFLLTVAGAAPECRADHGVIDKVTGFPFKPLEDVPPVT